MFIHETCQEHFWDVFHPKRRIRNKILHRENKCPLFVYCDILDSILQKNSHSHYYYYGHNNAFYLYYMIYYFNYIYYYYYYYYYVLY